MAVCSLAHILGIENIAALKSVDDFSASKPFSAFVNHFASLMGDAHAVLCGEIAKEIENVVTYRRSMKKTSLLSLFKENDSDAAKDKLIEDIKELENRVCICPVISSASIIFR
jgi:predicted AAA+ superfamily ATPase